MVASAADGPFRGRGEGPSGGAGPFRGGPHRTPGAGGFLLVEVLVAMVLLGVGALGAVALLAQASQAMHRAGELARGAPLAALVAEAGPTDGGDHPSAFLPSAFLDRDRDRDGDGEPWDAMTWWWEDEALHLRSGGEAGARAWGRRVHVAWLESLPLWEPTVPGMVSPEPSMGSPEPSGEEGGG